MSRHPLRSLGLAAGLGAIALVGTACGEDDAAADDDPAAVATLASSQTMVRLMAATTRAMATSGAALARKARQP